MSLKEESRTLIEEMKQYLPIPARFTKRSQRFLDQKGKHIDPNQEINIIDVFDSGDVGGIICAIENIKKDEKEAL